MKALDYLLMKAPEPEELAQGQEPKSVTVKSDDVSPRRIYLSLIGLFIGIILSFFVTGIELRSKEAPKQTETAKSADAQAENASTKPLAPEVNFAISWGRFFKVGILALVICGLTYPQLYKSLGLYQNEPAFLVLFVSFQYGYFWQSAIQAVNLVSGAFNT